MLSCDVAHGDFHLSYFHSLGFHVVEVVRTLDEGTKKDGQMVVGDHQSIQTIHMQADMRTKVDRAWSLRSRNSAHEYHFEYR